MGKITINGKDITKPFKLNGKTIKKITINGKDITLQQKGGITVPYEFWGGTVRANPSNTAPSDNLLYETGYKIVTDYDSDKGGFSITLIPGTNITKIWKIGLTDSSGSEIGSNIYEIRVTWSGNNFSVTVTQSNSPNPDFSDSVRDQNIVSMRVEK